MPRPTLALASLALLALAACTPSGGASDGVMQEIERQEAERKSEIAAAEAKVKDCLARAAAPEGMQATASGLRWAEVSSGDAALPKPGSVDVVRTHYIGALKDGGAVFDSSYARGEPAYFNISSVIRGWTEALQLIHPGAEICIELPPELAYGPMGSPPDIPPNATLVFSVKLLGQILPDGARIGDHSNP